MTQEVACMPWFSFHVHSTDNVDRWNNHVSTDLLHVLQQSIKLWVSVTHHYSANTCSYVADNTIWNAIREVTGYKLDNQGSILGRGRDFSHLHVQNGSVVYPDFIQQVPVSFPAAKTWSINLPTHFPFGVKIKTVWSFTSITLQYYMICCLDTHS